MAGLFVVEKKLYQWVVEQNKAKGVAPGRALLVERAVEAIPTELPPVVRGLLVRCFRRNGSRRCQRRWLAKFRKQYRVKLGKLRAQEQLSLADMKQKAGCFLSPVVEERQLCGRFPIIL